MTDLTVTPTDLDFAPVHQAMKRYVDQDILPGVSWAVLRGRDLIDVQHVGWADREAGVPWRADHIVRSYSDSKLVTSCAVMLLWEDGLIDLDAPIDALIPQLAARRVLRPGATSLDDSEPARSAITVRQLLTHTSGLSYGLLDPGTLIFKAYRERSVLHPLRTLEGMMDALHDLPLLFHPGTGFEYSVATDVLGRVVEVVSGQRFDAFLQQRIFGPLGMVDTGFSLDAGRRERLTAFYTGSDLAQPMASGLTRDDHAPYPGAYTPGVPWLSGGGGLVSTLPDMVALLRSLLPGGPTLLRPETLALMMRNHLPDGVWIRFPRFGEVVGKGFGLGGAVTLAPAPFDPPSSTGEFQWGGLGGTHWWISPEQNLAAVVQTQRHMAFWHPYAFEFKHAVYQAAKAG